MKQCLACNECYSLSQRSCPACGAEPVVLDGFEAYAPDFAHDGGGFQASYFSDLARLEAASFWFRARNEIIIWALNKYAPRLSSFLEIGCGTGYVLSGIAKRFPGAKLKGSEIFIEGLAFASTRLPAANLFQMDARAIPFYEEFDAIGAFDVLEHIKEDDAVSTQVHKALKPGGIFLLTVPQHPWLWSAVDEYALHERRYSAAEITAKVEAAGFRVIRSTSFTTTLLPAMMISRRLQRSRSDKLDPTAELRLSPLTNSIFSRMLGLELVAVKSGMNFPVGGSRLIVARRL